MARLVPTLSWIPGLRSSLPRLPSPARLRQVRPQLLVAGVGLVSFVVTLTLAMLVIRPDVPARAAMGLAANSGRLGSLETSIAPLTGAVLPSELTPVLPVGPSSTSASSTPAGNGPYGLTTPSALTSSGIPKRAYEAYRRAAALTATADPSCHLDWSVLAGIGRVESDHGRHGGSGLRTDGVVQPAILGIRLDGSMAGSAVITDSDGGRLDGDTRYDRAVGAMQFLPGTWAVYGADADKDGSKNPQDIDDAALGAAQYLCAGAADLSTTRGRWAAVYRYNHADSYVQLVLSLAASYSSGRVVGFAPAPPGAERPGGDQATPPGPPPAVPTPKPTPSAGPTSPRPTKPGATTAPPSATPTSGSPTSGSPTSGSPTSGSPTSSSPTSSSPASSTTSSGSSSSSSGSSSSSPSSADTTTSKPTSTSSSSEPTTEPAATSSSKQAATTTAEPASSSSAAAASGSAAASSSGAG